ncbi:MAG: chemotaxis protein CheA [Deltaproteobacteria bacterium]|nr:chemotaxis protein CheA [Deltaproteobacteria bacterium]
MSDEMQEIVADFVTEAEESLDRIDPLFVELEARGHDREILNDIFRCVHTLKGAAGFLGFQPVVDVSHASENIMKKLRDGEIGLSKPLVDVILKSVDMLRILIARVKHREDMSENISPLIAELAEALADAEGNGGKPSGAAPAGSAHAPAMETASRTPAPGNGSGVPAPVPASAPAAAKAATHVPASQASAPAAHAPEGDRNLPGKKDSVQNLRVDIARIDKVMDLTGEVVLARNRLLTLVSAIGLQYGDDPVVENLSETVSFLDLVTSDMQLSVMKMRMQALQKVFGKFPRIVRDIASSRGKDVELKIHGEDTEVDRSVIEHIGDPMVHILRNAIDHGIEKPEARTARGKPAQGVISIDACQKGNQIVIEVSDDGRGIDVVRVRKKAMEKGLVTAEEAERMSDDAAVNLIFQPGFTTMDVATELSGRGVGMDVVRTSIAKLGGFVDIRTRKDAGTTFQINIPLTLAIIQSLMVRAAGGRYAVPLTLVEEILRVTPSEIAMVAGQKVLVIRDKVHPYFELSERIGKGQPEESPYRYAVVVAVGDRRFCLGVDGLIGEEDVVIKPIDGLEVDSAHMIGATITGDGKVVLILDVASISRNLPGPGRAS